jgi:thiol-disulfide isomerase/thioredoxin
MKQFVAIGITIALFGCFGAEPQKTGKEGKPLPAFTMQLPDSIHTIHSQNIPAGKPFILFYMSPYCPYCKAQTKQMLEHMDDLKDVNIYFLSTFPIPTLKTFIEENQLQKYPNIQIGVDSANIVGDYFEITGIPYIAVYNKDKKLNKSYMGKVYISQIRKALDE